MARNYLKNRSFEFEKDQIVVGGDLRSLLYGAFKGIPVIYTDSIPPFRFDRLFHPNLVHLGLEPQKNYFAREVWERVVFLLGLSGLLLSSEGANSIRISDNQLILNTDYTSYKYNFKKLIVLQDQKISGLPFLTREEVGLNRVIDWVNVRSGCSHEHTFLEDPESNFVKEIYFYSSERSDNPKNKDLVSISYLTDEQIKDFDYSDTMAKFKIVKMMKAAGIRGARNGRDQKYPDRYKYYAVKVEPAEREVFSSTVRYYEPDERFVFCYDSLEDILDKGGELRGYLKKVTDAL